MTSHTPGSASHASMKSMKLNPFSLKFSGPMADIEASYRTFSLDRILARVRLSFVMGALLYGIFGILDAIVLPEHKHIAWLIRYVFVCPLLLFVAGVTFVPQLRRYIHPLMSLAVAVGGLGIVLMIIIAPEPGAQVEGA